MLEELGDWQMASIGEEYNVMVHERHMAFIVSRMSIEILDRVPKHTVLTGETWVTDGRAATFPRYYALKRGGKYVAVAKSLWALVNTENKRLLRTTDYDMSAYPHDEDYDMAIPSKFRFSEDIEWYDAGTFHVGFCKSDVNGHMNNCLYAGELYDRIPDAHRYELTSINIRFMAEAPYTSTAEVMRSDLVVDESMDPRADYIVYFKSTVEGKTNVEVAFGLKEIDGQN